VTHQQKKKKKRKEHERQLLSVSQAQESEQCLFDDIGIDGTVSGVADAPEAAAGTAHHAVFADDVTVGSAVFHQVLVFQVLLLLFLFHCFFGQLLLGSVIQRPVVEILRCRRSEIGDRAALGGSCVVDLRGPVLELRGPVPEFRASVPEFGASVLELRASVPEFRASVPEFRASVLELRASVPEFRASVSEFRASVLEFRSTVLRLVSDVDHFGSDGCRCRRWSFGGC